MQSVIQRVLLVAASLLALVSCSTAQSPQVATGKDMTYFITSVSPGKGADLGGLAGADQHCQSLAQAAGAGGRTWRAYLSTQSSGMRETDVVHARDRIGTGPWHNAKGVLIASSVDDLHSANSNLNKSTALDEKGNAVNGRTEKPIMHDILTGSRPDGTAFPPTPWPDMTCGNWTKSGSDGSAMLGHFDRGGPTGDSWAISWNSSHPSLGCDQKGLISTGGAGLLYCFAVK